MPQHSPTSVLLSRDQIQQQWDDLTAMELDWINGNSDRLIDAIVTKYGVSRDEAARQVLALQGNNTGADGTRPK